jgi:hypothetical protein
MKEILKKIRFFEDPRSQAKSFPHFAVCPKQQPSYQSNITCSSNSQSKLSRPRDYPMRFGNEITLPFKKFEILVVKERRKACATALTRLEI